MNKKITRKIQSNYQSGAASIFIVIFFALLLGVITVSFVNIVNTDQQQALNNDLSQSAYDAALAGAEDGKRALDYCLSNDTCKGDMKTKFQSECTDVRQFSGPLNLTLSEGTEVKVSQGSAGDDKFNQAYSCVDIQYETDNYVRKLEAGKSQVIHLKAEEGRVPNVLMLNWFTSKDAGVDSDPDSPTLTNVNLPSGSDNTSSPLHASGSQWGGAKTPPIMRLQLIKVAKNNPTLSQISNDSRVGFIYPRKNDNAVTIPIQKQAINTFTTGDSGRSSVKASPSKATCEDRFNTTEYVCNAAMLLPGGNAYDYYLVVTPIYNTATFELKLFDGGVGGGVVKFDGVQPVIDSTGRANDVYRRVEIRVEPTSNNSGGFDLPGFDFTNAVCKNFSVGSIAEHYTPDADCALPSEE